MSASYVIEPIGEKTIDRTYPLARVIGPAFTLNEWREFCRVLELPRVRREAPVDSEEIVVALNAQGYVKGLCIYSIRDHATYGRVLDVPFVVAASAGDGEGVAAEVLDFLRSKCDKSVCSGIRFWTVSPETWDRRLNPDHIRRTDHGMFMPALASAADIERALCAHTIGAARAIDQLSR
jgi:hypothetical protein